MAISKRAPVLDRMMDRREVTPSGCWLYTGSLDDNGYGVIGYQGTHWKVHRLSITLMVGPIPDGWVGDHKCHNEDPTCRGGRNCQHRRCFNPEHAPPVPKDVNNRTGRHGSHMAERTHCPANHPYAEFGITYPSSKGKRECRECKRLRSAAFYARRRAEKAMVD